MKLTNLQKSRALSIVAGFIVEGVPGFVTPREASDLCARYGVTNDRFRRIAKADQNSRPIGIAAIAVEIAKKEGSK